MGAALVLAGTSLPTSPSLTLALITWGAGVCLVLLPLAIGAAILRYRLYDLDRIISRTLAYGLLTLLLGLAYAAVVLGLGQLLRQGSSLVVAAATLAVAAIFQPARRRIQARSTAASTGAATTPPGPSPLQRPAARPGRPGHPDRRAAGGGRPDHATGQRVAVAPAATRPRPAAVRH